MPFGELPSHGMDTFAADAAAVSAAVRPEHERHNAPYIPAGDEWEERMVSQAAGHPDAPLDNGMITPAYSPNQPFGQ